MYTLKVIAHSKSGKTILASVSKKVGIFTSVVATGNIKLSEGEELPAVGTLVPLEGVTKVSVIQSQVEDSDKTFDWLSLD